MVTPQIKADKLAKKIGLNMDLYLKREDLHPLGSHKGRSLPLMIDKYAAEGIKNFVISSSGNAALAAAKHIQKLGLTLTIFVGEKIDQNKLNDLKKYTNEKITIAQVTNPKQQALQMDKAGQAKNLRQSTDDQALFGYHELAKELSEIKNLQAVFVPTSSGTTAQGLYDGFQILGLNPQIHIVQTTACHPITDVILSKAKNPLTTTKRDPSAAPQDDSLATAIVDKVAQRKNKVAQIIKNSHGQGWIATDAEIMEAVNIIKSAEGIDVSPNSALSLVGLLQTLKSSNKFTGPVVCLLTGK